jgi:hypothetical protein
MVQTYFITIITTICFTASPAFTKQVPGVVINHSPASSQTYLGSPSIAILPNGDYVVSHDCFGPGARAKGFRTSVFNSKDKGKSWQHLTDIYGQYWSTLFIHNKSLYIMGTGGPYGHAVIRRSTDGGRTWTTPKDKESGLILDDGKYHTAPVPVVIHKGRIWRAMEDAMGPGGWGHHFRAFMMSAPVDADLLKAESWICSNRLGRNPKWLNEKFGGWLEGNAVVTPDGNIVNILRVDYRPEGGKAAVINISSDGKKASFEPETGFIDFPGGCKKFTIRYDNISKKYWTLSNAILPRHKGDNPERTRNAVVLMSSPDLREWNIHSIILYHPDVKYHAFQYLDWQLEGNDIIAISRTAYDEETGIAHNQHDANYMTFHQVRNFRKMTLADSIVQIKQIKKKLSGRN